jgi:ribonucleoside-diphosphate reductase alpha chain
MDFIQFKNKLNPKNERIIKSLERITKRKDVAKIVEKILADDQLTHFNISVGVWDSYIQDYLNGVESVVAIFRAIAENAWKNGDPGIYFIDNANSNNIAPYLGKLLCTNPCGEVPLYPYEACCLGSINLSNFVEEDFIDFEYLGFVVKTAVRFLDNVQTLSIVPVPEINEATKNTRRLGLGVMGFADILSEMQFEYDSDQAFILADVLAKFIQKSAWEASMELAQERGAFPAFRKSLTDWTMFDNLGLPRYPVRNIAVTSIAPTGTIALLCDVNSGIEPFFSRKYTRNITEGVGNEAKDTMAQEHNVVGKTAHEIHWKEHILMQSIWQKYVDNAVSKTINMPHTATEQEILDAYILAWEKGCKGITVYRDKSRAFQILESGE